MDDAEPIGVALVGSGLFVQREHLPAILKTTAISLQAVFSRSLKSAVALTKDLTREIAIYSEETAEQSRGFKELLQDPSIQAVVIALPILVQPAYIRQALDAGKHVLSEKPIAADSKIARELLSWYKGIKDSRGCTWSIAENFRFVDSHVKAANEIHKLGRVLGFRHYRNSMMTPDNAYYNTSWRKTPGYQGGFVLDGGIHSVAALRMLLGPENEIARVSAFTAQLQEHLPPVDTVNATIMTRSGVSGTFTFSNGTTFKGLEFAIACDAGTVTVTRGQIAVIKGSVEETKDFPEYDSGVHGEIKAWCGGIQSGNQNLNLVPEEALKDLEVLEALLRSGENKGAPHAVEL